MGSPIRRGSDSFEKAAHGFRRGFAAGGFPCAGWLGHQSHSRVENRGLARRAHSLQRRSETSETCATGRVK